MEQYTSNMCVAYSHLPIKQGRSRTRRAGMKDYGVQRRANISGGEGEAKMALCTVTNHLLLSELALSLLFGLIQVKLTPLADKWTKASYFHFLTHSKNPDV